MFGIVKKDSAIFLVISLLLSPHTSLISSCRQRAVESRFSWSVHCHSGACLLPLVWMLCNYRYRPIHNGLATTGCLANCGDQVHDWIYGNATYNTTTPRRVLKHGSGCSKSFDESPIVHLRDMLRAERASGWWVSQNSLPVHRLYHWLQRKNFSKNASLTS